MRFLPVISLVLLVSMTGPASPPMARTVLVPQDVILCERMPVLAMRFAGVDVGHATRGQLRQVFAGRDGQQMIGIATPRILAEVMQFVPRWDGAFQQPVRHAMRAVGPILPTSQPNLPVSDRQCSRPVPATRVRHNDSLHQAFENRFHIPTITLSYSEGNHVQAS